jgi:hypothetical protein
MFRLHSELPRSDEKLREHAAALRKMLTSREHQELFKHLYDRLSILDAKSASLLAFNSIIIAVFAIFMGSVARGSLWILANCGMAMVVASCLLLLWVVWVRWSSTDDLDDVKGHGDTLLRVWRSRTVQYRLAWRFSVLAMLVLSAFLIARFVGSFLHPASPASAV